MQKRYKGLAALLALVLLLPLAPAAVLAGDYTYDLAVGNVSITFTGANTFSVTHNGVTDSGLTSGVDVVHVSASGAVPAGRVISVDGASQTITAPVEIEIVGITAAGVGSRISLTNGANAHLVVTGTNNLTSSSAAAVSVPVGNTILINGSGSLNVQAGGTGAGAGIGGTGQFGHAGTIHINGSVTVTSVGTALGAGIGGGGSTTAGYGGDGGHITIDGSAHVSASSPGQDANGCGAGIGGGSEGTGGVIVIGGNAVVRAQSNQGGTNSAGAAIGAGGDCVQADITIQGSAVVYAYAAGWGCSAAIGGSDCRRGGGGLGSRQDISIRILDSAKVYAYKLSSIGAAIGTGAVVAGHKSQLTDMSIIIGNSDGTGSPQVVAIGGTGYAGYSSPAIGYATNSAPMKGPLNIEVNAGEVIAFNQSTNANEVVIGASKGAPASVTIKFGDEVSVVTVMNNSFAASTASTTSVRPVNGAGEPLYYLPIRTVAKATGAPLTLVETELYQGDEVAGTPVRTDYSFGLEWIVSKFQNDSKDIFSADTTLWTYLETSPRDARGMIGYWLTADTTATTYSLLGSKADYIDKELEKQVLPAANKAAITLLELEKPSVKYHANGAASGMDWSVEVATNSSHTVQGKGALTAPLGALVFKGWSTLPDGTGLHYSAGSTLSVAQSDIDLYAQWGSGEIKPFVNYHANGASGADRSVEVTANASHTVQEATGLTAPGALVFKGWNTQPGGGGTTYAAGSSLSVAEADVDLYAQWGTAASNVSVYYHANGAGSGSDWSVEVAANSSHTVQEAIGLTAPRALVFKGWNTQPGGGGTAYAAGSSLSVAEVDVDLYAQWGTTTGGRKDDDDDWTSSAVTLPLPILPPKTGGGGGAAWLLCVAGGIALAFAFRKKRQSAK